MRRNLLLVAFAAAVAGCSLTLDTKELDPLQEPQGFCESAQTETIRLFERCFSFMSGYEEILYGFLQSYCGAIGTDVASGSVAYSREAAGECLEAIQSTRCDQFFSGLFSSGGCPAIERFGFPAPALCSSSCRAALAGRIGNGDGCTTDLQCTSGFCDVPSLTCGGTCIAGDPGDPCDSSHACASGNYCRIGSCTRYQTSIDADCTTVQCNPTTLYCNQVTKKCAQLVGADGSCGGMAEALCANGLVCDTTPKCVTKAALGESCLMKPCGLGLSCYALTLQCIPTPTGPGPLGADCHSPLYCNGDFAYCDSSSTTPTFTCVPLETSGACSNYFECAHGYQCNGTNCVPLKEAGEACMINNYECKSGGACVPNPAGGAWCVREPTTVGAECGSFGGGESIECISNGDLYCDESTIPGHCAATQRPGDPCAGSYQCADRDRGAFCDFGSGTCTAACW